jgi:aspartate carbamoyltransferase catalytic subunit
LKKGLIKIFRLKNIISIKDFEREDIEYILDEASKLENIAKSKEISEELKGKILGLMFFEPSTRTRISFETAMKRLNGQCIGFTSSGSSSVSKGESIADTAKMFEGYSDALVIRHELEGVSKFISDIVDVPVINAGDGAGQHPTQTLLDLYTIKNEIGHIDDLKIALIGDLKFGRTVHSLSHALSLFDNVKIYMVSPPELRMPQEILLDLDKTNVEYEEVENIEDIIDDVNVLYVTRIQKERFADIDDYLNIKGAYIINKKMLEGKDLIVMHPLPRVDEIYTDVDDTKYNKYFTQAANAVPVRMAILKTLIKNNPK